MIVNNHSDRPRYWDLCIRALPAIALVLAIAAKPASAAARVAGMGGTVIGENVFSSTDFWNGSAFEAGVELQALCA